MRRDISYTYACDVRRLYEAFLQAASKPPFERSCRQEPYHTLTFGLNFSMKYNFNGGSCTLHFAPYQNGAAVSMRFTLAQAAGARYEKYAQDLMNQVYQILGISGTLVQISVDYFLQENNKIHANSMTQPVSPASARTIPAQPPKAEPSCKCAVCGKAIDAQAKFCTHCGSPATKANNKFCGNCGAPASQGDLFCGQCGRKL